MEHVFQEPVDDMRRLDWRKFVEKYDQFSLQAYLNTHNVSRHLTDLIGVVLNQETIFPMGLIEFIIDECLFSRAGLITVKNGFDQFPKKLYKLVSNTVRFNSRVCRVKHSGPKVEVKY